MGMFDHVYININKLPLLNTKEKEVLGDNHSFQTKDFDRVLTNYYITDNNRLKYKDYRLESVPKEERPYPDDNGIKSLFGCMRETGVKILDLPDFSGILNFYTYFNIHTDVYDFEFNAFFENGNLINIERIDLSDAEKNRRERKLKIKKLYGGVAESG